MNDESVTDDLNSVKATDQQATTYQKARSSPSLFGPIVLITVGVIFLLANLGRLPETLNWDAAMRLWPLLLVFLGLNLIVRQAPRPFGSLLSALVAIAAILTFGYVVLYADQIPFLQSETGASRATTLQRDVPISYARGGIDSAEVRIDLGEIPAYIGALENDDNLIEGTVTYAGDLIFNVTQDGNSAEIVLDTHTADWWFFDPGNWSRFSQDDRWDIGLNPDVIYDLQLDAASGRYDIDLDAFTVTDFDFDAGSGAGTLVMPGGAYAARIDIGSGAFDVVLPRHGQQQIEVDGGSGGLHFLLSDSMEARIEVDYGSGAFSGGDRLQGVNADGDATVWETGGYAAATDRILLVINGGSGAIAIETAAQGR